MAKRQFIAWTLSWTGIWKVSHPQALGRRRHGASFFGREPDVATPGGVEGIAKVLDLGLALLQTDEDSSITADPTQPLGTADYISPEQALNSRQLDARSDIYSLGCSLYFLLTGTAPFASGTNSQRLLAHQLHDPIPINEAREKRRLPAVGTQLVQICTRMMSKTPADRFASAFAVAKTLEPIAGTDSDPATGAIELLPDDFQSNQSTLDTQSLEQLKTISESASNSSIRNSGRTRGLSRRPRDSQANKRPTIVWGIGIGTAAIVLLAVSLLAMQTWSHESPVSTSRPAETTSATLDHAFPGGPFYTVGNNRTYHTGDCQHVQGKDNLHPVTQQMLDAGNLKPCRICRPGSK